MAEKINALQKKLRITIASSQAVIFVRSDEHDDVIANLKTTCQELQLGKILDWDCDRGLTIDGQSITKPPEPKGGLAAMAPKARGADDAIAAIKAFEHFDNKDIITVMVLHNLHRFLQQNELVQVIQNFVRVGKNTHKCLIGLSYPGCELPPELSQLFTIIDHELPTQEEFKTVLDSVELEGAKELSPATIDEITAASCGLTRLQAENTYASSHITSGQVTSQFVESSKNDLLNADKILMRYEGKEVFADIGGNDALKEFLMRAMDPTARKRERSRIRAVCLCGAPGTGKTLIAKALGNEVGKKTYSIDLGRCKGKYVGESEAATRKLYNRLDVMSPLIAYYDEINEQISSGGGDEHSVDKSQLHTTLTWLNDHTTDVFVIMTANDISTMHMALLRSGRVDAIWYVGLPGKEQRNRIWTICQAKYEIVGQERPDDEGWAGAEIEACCRLADNMGYSLIEAAKFITPTSIRAEEQINALKRWANGRVLDAESGGMFIMDKVEKAALEAANGQRLKRKVRRIPQA